MGSGCGSDGRAVASDTRGPRSESSHRQNFYIEHLFTVSWNEKTIIKKKSPGMAHLQKITATILNICTPEMYSDFFVLFCLPRTDHGIAEF